MSRPVNLNKVRKDRARAAKRARADENAFRFGRTKSEKDTDAREADKAARFVDDHKRET